jgi:hypothetical protein
MKGPDGSDIAPTGKSFEVDFYTVAKVGRCADRRREPDVRPRHLPEADRPQRLRLTQPVRVLQACRGASGHRLAADGTRRVNDPVRSTMLGPWLPLFDGRLHLAREAYFLEHGGEG